MLRWLGRLSGLAIPALPWVAHPRLVSARLSGSGAGMPGTPNCRSIPVQ